MTVLKMLAIAGLAAITTGGFAQASTVNLALGGTVTASETYGDPSSVDLLNDGDYTTSWVAPSWSGWVDIDLGATYLISSIRALSFQAPDGYSENQIYLDGMVTGISQIGDTYAGQWVDFVFAAPISARFVRVATDTSVSWVSWGEIEVMGEAVAPVPLPAGLPLLLAGLGALGLMRRRKA